jgi:hypothetical protein
LEDRWLDATLPGVVRRTLNAMLTQDAHPIVYNGAD